MLNSADDDNGGPWEGVERHFQENNISLDFSENENRCAKRAQMRKIASNTFENNPNYHYLDDGIKRLYLATVLQAVTDLRSDPSDGTLKKWLIEDGLFILESYDQPVRLSKWKSFVLAGCPGAFRMSHK